VVEGVAPKDVLGIVYLTNPIQMRHARIVELNLQSNVNFPPSKAGEVHLLDPYPISLTTGIGRVTAVEGLSFLGKLTIELHNAEGRVPPYQFKIALEGLFQCVAKLDEQAAEKLAAIHGSAALFAMARELLANLTSRSVNGVVLLPAIMFAPPKPVGATSSKAPKENEEPKARRDYRKSRAEDAPAQRKRRRKP
jgi:hypothetical protein